MPGISASVHGRGDRALSGGLIGADGALLGAATNPHDLNLGRPAWR